MRGRINRLLSSSTLVILAFCGSAAGTESWPDFRGPWGTGHVSAPGDAQLIGLPLHWSETRNVTWKTEIPHVGLSTPAVMGGQVWLTAAPDDGHDFFAICVDAETGKVLLNKNLFHSDKPESLGNGAGVNSYATPSAVIEPGRVYVHFGRFGTACLDTTDFKLLWKREDLHCRHYRGPSSSPVLFENMLILTMDGADVQYLVALDKKTGRTVWKTDRSVKWNDEHIDRQMVRDGDWRTAHSTPLIVSVGGKPQMLSIGAKAGYGYEPRTGRELWRVEFPAYSAAPRPLLYKACALMVTGFSHSELLAVRTDGTGNVTDTHVDWSINTSVPKYASPILVDDLLYLAADQSFITCVEAATGEKVWRERGSGKYRASPVYADGRLYFFSLDGTTTVIKPGRKFELLATNMLTGNIANNDQKRGPGFMASPAVAGKAFFLRTRHHLYRVEDKG